MQSPRPLPAVLLAWFLSVGVDLFLHGGLLARLYVAPSPFLLPAGEAFRRIPFGYLAFLVLTAGLYWFCRSLGVRGVAAGARYGFLAGLVVWGAVSLGLYSISSATVPLLVAWWLGQSVELGFAGAVLGGLAAGVPTKRMLVWVALAVAAFFAMTVVLQSLGLAPSIRFDK